MIFIFFAVFLLPAVNGQGCSNTCPPLNAGTPVPALCEGDYVESFADTSKQYPICHGGDDSSDVSFSIDSLRGKVAVFANFYTGCNAGRRESGVFAHVAQRFYDLYGADNVVFVQSIKGGGTCGQWASSYQQDATSLYPDSTVQPKQMPLSVDDVNYEIRDDLFTTPFGHPSYIILDPNQMVRHKFIGPCCGYAGYFDCTSDIAKGLDQQLTEYLEPILSEAGMEPIGDNPAPDQTSSFTPAKAPSLEPTISSSTCATSEWDDWSPCSVSCTDSLGIQFRFVTNSNDKCTDASSVETRSCEANQNIFCHDEGSCISEFGASWTVETVATGFDSPRDVDFHPTPGLHLGEYSEGRTFYPNVGQEAWVVNGGNHSVSIVASLGTQYQTTISRRDRGYYHYMINGTAISFNKVSDSTRSPDRDSFNYWAICNDNLNTYLDAKEPNYFMGPTLYDSHPENLNTVNRLGEECRPEEPCYFLHADMLHESPACIGIAHDPEVQTAYGTVYWAFDATGNRESGQLVRFDFQQPHGPGSMDHSVAAIRRYVEVELERGPAGVHAGIVVHPTRRQVYIAVPGADKILVVEADSGSFARTARDEYPIFSNRLPSFEYSIWECVDHRVFAEGIQMPTGMALSDDGERLFVAERGTGKILVYEIDSGAFLFGVDTEFSTMGGMAISPSTSSSPGMLYFVDDETGSLNRVEATVACDDPIQSRTNPEYAQTVINVEESVEGFSLTRDYGCQVNPVIPDSAFFDQVHDDTGYADDNPDVQSNVTGMDSDAALLADRTDCGFDSELNFDAILLGGYFCHQCLPDQDLSCDHGGRCSNVQWQGYVCDNEFLVEQDDTGAILLKNTYGTVLDPATISLSMDVTYRFTVVGDLEVCASQSDDSPLACASRGPLLFTTNDPFATSVNLFFEGETDLAFGIPVEISVITDPNPSLAPTSAPTASPTGTVTFAPSLDPSVFFNETSMVADTNPSLVPTTAPAGSSTGAPAFGPTSAPQESNAAPSGRSYRLADMLLLNSCLGTVILLIMSFHLVISS